MKDPLLRELEDHWQQLRSMTYDFLNAIKEEDLDKKLPFPESQSLSYQFWCMTGAQESSLSLITEGAWKGFSCSLDAEAKISRHIIVDHMKRADTDLLKALSSAKLLQQFEDRSTPLLNYLTLVEHESHHHGQIINFIYAHNLDIPMSWKEKWALAK